MARFLEPSEIEKALSLPRRPSSAKAASFSEPLRGLPWRRWQSQDASWNEPVPKGARSTFDYDTKSQ